MPHVCGQREEPELGPRRPLVGRRHQAKFCDPSSAELREATVSRTHTSARFVSFSAHTYAVIDAQACGRDAVGMCGLSLSFWPVTYTLKPSFPLLRIPFSGELRVPQVLCTSARHSSGKLPGRRSRFANEPLPIAPRSNGCFTQLTFECPRYKSLRSHSSTVPSTRFRCSLALAHHGLPPP